MKVLFVCSGNTCRSPFAEAVAASLGFEARSAGMTAAAGSRATPDAVAAADRRGFDLRAHRAARLDEDLVAWADVVVAFEQAHLEAVDRYGGRAKARLVPVGDPFFDGAYESAYDRIDEAVRALR